MSRSGMVLWLAAMSGIAPAVLAQSRPVKASVDTVLTATDNAAHAAADEKRSDLSASVRPAVAWSRSAAGSQLDLDAAVTLLGYARGTGRGGVYPEARMAWKSALVDRWLLLDADATVRQSQVDPFGAQLDERSGSNRRTEGTYRLTPLDGNDYRQHAPGPIAFAQSRRIRDFTLLNCAAASGRAVLRGIRSAVVEPPLRPLRAYLLTLVLGVVLPLSVLSLLQAVDGAERQRAAVEAGLVDTSRALSQTVEHELLRSIAALSVLAASPRLAAGDTAGFYEEARTAMRQEPWYTMWLADAQGNQVINLLAPPGSPLPPLGDRAYFAEAVRTRRPAVSGLLVGRVSGAPNVTVVVPYLRNGEPAYVIGAAMHTTVFDEILASVNHQVGTATASVVGRDYIVIARNRDAARWVGRRAHESYIASVSQAGEGLVRARTLEGDVIYAAVRRLPASGWTVGMGVPASEVDGPMQRALWISAGVGAAVLLLAGAVAVLLSRRITVPIRALAASARDIAMGRHGPVPQASGIAEIATLAGALRIAAEATRDRSELAEQTRRITAELEAAEIRERQQIARELHDDLAQTLSAVQIRLARLQSHADPDVSRLATGLAELVERANRSTRSLAEQLAPPVLYELGLVPALEWLAQQLGSDYGVQIDIQDDGQAKPLSVEAASIVFRCVRELLLNVARHAKVPEAAVMLRVEGEAWLAIRVMDGGCGFEVPDLDGNGRPRIGLMAVKEHLAHLGGSFELRSVPGHGTEAVLRVPLQLSKQEEREP